MMIMRIYANSRPNELNYEELYVVWCRKDAEAKHVQACMLLLVWGGGAAPASKGMVQETQSRENSNASMDDIFRKS